MTECVTILLQQNKKYFVLQILQRAIWQEESVVLSARIYETFGIYIGRRAANRTIERLQQCVR